MIQAFNTATQRWVHFNLATATATWQHARDLQRAGHYSNIKVNGYDLI